MLKYFNRICLINLTLGCLLILWTTPISSNAAEPIKVAFIFSQTGIAINENIPGIEGSRLAVDEINESGGGA